MELAEFTQSELAKKLKVSQGTVSKWLSGEHTPNKKQWDSVLMLIGRDRRLSDLRSGGRIVNVVGYVGAGGATSFYADTQGPLEEVEAPEGSTDSTVAVEIRGDCLGSIFDRWLVFYDDVRRPITPDLVGRLCVIGLDDGSVLIKKIQRSKTKGFFHLLSNIDPPLLDVAIDWAARVKSMMPR
jgi:transcriptional regulator with XRE-family HTH domain